MRTSRKPANGRQKPLPDFLVFVAAVALTSLAGTSHAALMPIGIGDFSGTETVIDYSAVPLSTPVHGETVDGVLHEFTIGGVPSNQATIGTLDTDHVTGRAILGRTSGILSLQFPDVQTRMGFGWSLSDVGTGGVQIELFDAADTSLGAVDFSGSPDPFFVGGFAGVESDTPFSSAEVSWLHPGDIAFAFDNLRFERAAVSVPEPSPLALLGLGFAALGLVRRRALEPGRR